MYPQTLSPYPISYLTPQQQYTSLFQITSPNQKLTASNQYGMIQMDTKTNHQKHFQKFKCFTYNTTLSQQSNQHQQSNYSNKNYQQAKYHKFLSTDHAHHHLNQMIYDYNNKNQNNHSCKCLNQHPQFPINLPQLTKNLFPNSLKPDHDTLRKYKSQADFLKPNSEQSNKSFATTKKKTRLNFLPKSDFYKNKSHFKKITQIDNSDRSLSPHKNFTKNKQNIDSSLQSINKPQSNIIQQKIIKNTTQNIIPQCQNCQHHNQYKQKLTTILQKILQLFQQLKLFHTIIKSSLLFYHQYSINYYTKILQILSNYNLQSTSNIINKPINQNLQLINIFNQNFNQPLNYQILDQVIQQISDDLLKSILKYNPINQQPQPNNIINKSIQQLKLTSKQTINRNDSEQQQHNSIQLQIKQQKKPQQKQKQTYIVHFPSPTPKSPANKIKPYLYSDSNSQKSQQLCKQMIIQQQSPYYLSLPYLTFPTTTTYTPSYSYHQPPQPTDFPKQVSNFKRCLNNLKNLHHQQQQDYD